MAAQPLATVLLVEDERELGRLLERELRSAGYRVRHATDGPAALRLLAEEPPDLVILDWMLPGLDGLEVLRRLRRGSAVPVLMLTARAEEADRVIGLEVGADDYLTKPFSIRELIARVRALLRRQERLAELLAADRAFGGAALRLGPLELDPAAHLARLDGQELDLTRTELALLHLLLRNRGRAFSRAYLREVVWGEPAVEGDRSVDNAILRLRKKLGPLGAAMVLAVGVAAVLVALDVRDNGGQQAIEQALVLREASPAARAVAWLTIRVLPSATALLLLSAAVAFAVVPPAALISYRVLRRTTGRLEALTRAAGALRTGDLTARVAVDGADDVARLQADFNAMAADLERTLRDLAAERDRVAGLLDARRQLVTGVSHTGVSHELRTPVATVRGYLEAARRHDDVPAELRADLAAMEREIARLQRLIEDLFTLARAAVGRLELRPEPIDAGTVVRRRVETAAPLAWRQRRVEVLAEVAPDLPLAHADAQRLEQIISNLLGNAVRHTPPGGLVAAAVTAEPDAVRIEVRDTGDGIAPDDLPRVFERFYRGRDEREDGGAGLGLALVKELAEAMGGSVAAASNPGAGSCFPVRLPRA